MNGMFRLSEATSLAVHGMALLAMSGKRMSIKEMVEVLEVSEAHMAKVFQRLSKEGLVTSLRGPRGGFELSRARDSITLYDIYVAMEGEPDTHKCLLCLSRCPFKSCIFPNVPEKISDDFLKYLKKTTLESVFLSDDESDVENIEREDD